MSDVLRSC